MQTKFTRVSLPILALCSLAACGGGGGSESRPSFEELSAGETAMATRIDALDATETMPTTGSTIYNGYLNVSTSVGGDILGEITMNADFDDNGITGTASNFADANGGLYDGSVGLNGTISGNGFSGGLAGTLTDQDDELLAVTGEIDGGFLGANAEAISAEVEGTINWSGDPGNPIGFEGGFIAER